MFTTGPTLICCFVLAAASTSMTASPVSTPTRTENGTRCDGPAAAHCRRASAARSARAGSSSCAMGAPKSA
jgi:hypothetical protein